MFQKIINYIYELITRILNYKYILEYEKLIEYYHDNYDNIIVDNRLLNIFFEKLYSTMNDAINKRLILTIDFDASYYILYYSHESNIISDIERIILFLKIYQDFKKKYYENFIQHRKKYNVSNIDFIVRTSFKGKLAGGIDVKDHLVLNKKFHIPLKKSDFNQFIIKLNVRFLEIAEKYQVDKWENIIVKII